jgi:hypothetical protein
MWSVYDMFIIATPDGFAVKLDNGYFSFFKNGKAFVMKHLDFATVVPTKEEARQLCEKLLA